MLTIARFDVPDDNMIQGMLWLHKSLLLLDFHYIAFSRQYPASHELSHLNYIQLANAVLPDNRQPAESQSFLIEYRQLSNSLTRSSRIR